MTFDFDTFLNIVLPYAISGAALALASYHVKNAAVVAADTGSLIRDALSAMHSSNKTLVAALAVSAPVLMGDAAKVVGDLAPMMSPLVAAVPAAVSQISATVTAIGNDVKSGDVATVVQAAATELNDAAAAVKSL